MIMTTVTGGIFKMCYLYCTLFFKFHFSHFPQPIMATLPVSRSRLAPILASPEASAYKDGLRGCFFFFWGVFLGDLTNYRSTPPRQGGGGGRGGGGLLPVIITFKCFLMARTRKDSRCGVGDAARETEDGADNRFQ